MEPECLNRQKKTNEKRDYQGGGRKGARREGDFTDQKLKGKNEVKERELDKCISSL